MQTRKIAEFLLDKLESSLSVSYRNRRVKLATEPVWQEIQKEDNFVREEIALLALERMGIWGESRVYELVRKNIFKSELDPKKGISQSFLIQSFDVLEKGKNFFGLPTKEILFSFQYYKEKFGQDAALKSVFEHFKKVHDSYEYAPTEIKKFIIEIDKIDAPEAEPFVFSIKDSTGKELEKIWSENNTEINQIIEFCWTEKYRSNPTKAWLKKAQSLVASSKNIEQQAEVFSGLFDWIVDDRKRIVKELNKATYEATNEAYQELLSNYKESLKNEDGLCYLIWYSSLLNSEKLNSSIGRLALASFAKIRWEGSCSTRNGNASLLAFTFMPEEVGIINLLNIRNKTQNKNIKKLADKHIKNKATELGLSEVALLELSAPDFGMKDFKIRKYFGDFSGIIETTSIQKPTIKWLNNKTESFQKSIPKEVKDNFGEGLKHFKNLHKDLITAFSAHTIRLENAFTDKIEWTLVNWKKYYIDHPFLSRYNSLLIWYFDEAETAIYHQETWVNSQGENIDIETFEKVKLWHPIYADVETVIGWRDFMMANEIKQPFKQAFREVYKVTDAELTTDSYSNRFAAHLIFQFQFAAIAKQRNWTYSLQGTFDSHNRPTRTYPAYNYNAEFWVEPVHDSLEDGILFSYLSSDQVRVYEGREVVSMGEIPEILFSEIMRDVDLFVGVCSVGNNPEWEDGGETGQNYWQSYSFGELSTNAETRKAVLKSILPKLKIANQCTLTDRFLEVEGKIRRYKIHLGSGNILMSPNDEYLCIVPNSNKKKDDKIFLPFDGDRTLSIILSKAFMLAADNRIKDQTILRQIEL